MKIKTLLYVLVVLPLSACQDQGQPPAPAPAPTEVSGTENGYNPELEEDIPLLPSEAVNIDTTLGIALSAPAALLYGEEIDEEQRRFRAVTWNVRQLTMTTKDNDIRMKPQGSPAPAGTVKKSEAIFKTLKLYGIHIAALQEVYRPETGGGFPLPATGEGYKVLRGGVIKTNNNATPPFRYEHCPIAFRPAKFDCGTEERTDTNARVYWTKCTIKGTSPVKEFWFGCAHYGTTGVQLTTNTKNFFGQLDATPPKKPTVGNNPATQDNFIMGLDANSSPTGYEKDKWTTPHNVWKTGHAGNANAIVFPTVAPPNTATKIYKKSNPPPPKIQVTSNVGKKVIDFLIHSFKGTDIIYDPGSMKALDVRMLNSDLTGQANWLEYHKLADHIPVKADYTY